MSFCLSLPRSVAVTCAQSTPAKLRGVFGLVFDLRGGRFERIRIELAKNSMPPQNRRRNCTLRRSRSADGRRSSSVKMISGGNNFFRANAGFQAVEQFAEEIRVLKCSALTTISMRSRSASIT